MMKFVQQRTLACICTKKDDTKEKATYWMNDFICDEMYPEFLFDNDETRLEQNYGFVRWTCLG